MPYAHYASSYWDTYITPRPRPLFSRSYWDDYTMRAPAPRPVEAEASYSYNYRYRASPVARPVIRDREDETHRLRRKCDELYEEARMAQRKGEYERAERRLREVRALMKGR